MSPDTPDSTPSKWVDVRLQLGFILALLGAAAAGVALHGLLTARLLGTLAVRMQREGTQVLDSAPELVYRSALVALELLVPVLFIAGLVVSFRVLVPLRRSQQRQEELVRRDDPSPVSESRLDRPAPALPQRRAPRRSGPHDG